MKAKDVFLFMLSALLLFGVYSNFTPAIVITYICYFIIMMIIGISLWVLYEGDLDSIKEAKCKFTTPKMLFSITWSVFTAYVLYISNNFNLLWTFAFVQSLTYIFIFKLFTTEGKSE